MTKVIGYIRVSTAEQVERESLPIQKKNIEKYCAIRAFDLVDILIEEGVSASKRPLQRRPAGRQLCANLRAGMASAVVVPAMDRLFRNVLDGLMFMERYGRRHDIDVISLQESIDTSTAHGKFAFTVLLATGQLESDRLSERNKAISKGLLEQGRSTGGPAYGCLVNPEERHGKMVQMLYRDPYTWPIRERIVDLYRDGDDFGLRRIVRIMDAEDIATPGGGKRWHPQMVKRIVDSHDGLQAIPDLPKTHEAKASVESA